MIEHQHPAVLGVGSPIIDILAQIPEAFLGTVPGEKGGMELVTPEMMNRLVASLPTSPSKAPGGSAANTVCALARLGMPVALLGKMGNDEMAEFYREAFAAVGGADTCFKYTHEKPTARCLSLITPDGERTMRTDLGAAMLLMPDEVVPEEVAACTHVHMEGYTLLDRPLAQKVFETARTHDRTISLDMGSFEVVRAVSDQLATWLRDYVDMVFANEDEAGAFCGSTDPERGLAALCEVCDVAAVKIGARGAWLQHGDERCFAEARPVRQVVDTTGAGDCWAGGFLYGFLTGMSLAECGALASLVGAETVSALGASPTAAGWDRILAFAASLNT